MTTDPVPVQVALAEIRGELATIATQLEAGDKSSAHLFELLKEQLGYQTRTLDELKAGLQGSRDEFRAMVTAMRLDVVDQIAQVARELASHEGAKNPHPLQEEWIRANQRQCADEVGILRNEIDRRLKPIEDKMNREEGANEARKPVNAFFVGVLSAVSAAIAIAVVLGVLNVISFE